MSCTFNAWKEKSVTYFKVKRALADNEKAMKLVDEMAARAFYFALTVNKKGKKQ